MGIQGLMKLLHEEAPDSIKEHEGFAPLTGRKIAIDASMAMYQFLVAVRSTGGGGPNVQLTNEAGEVTSHVQGMFNRTIKMMEGGLKPCYVFDGKPPSMKSGELAKRMAKRAKAETDLAAAKEAGEAEDIDRFSRRLVKVTKQHNDDCKILLGFMGVPVVNAPCEAEAQCAELAKAGIVWATSTEDMDALTFRTPKLIRKLTFSQNSTKDKKSQPIIEIDCEKVLTGMNLTYEQFVDLCIMCGCDYCNTIKGIGPKNALKLIREHKNIETIIEHLNKGKKYDIPADWKEQRVSKKAMELATKLAEDEQKKREEKEEILAKLAAAASVIVDTDTPESDANTLNNTDNTAASTGKDDENHTNQNIHSLENTGATVVDDGTTTYSDTIEQGLEDSPDQNAELSTANNMNENDAQNNNHKNEEEEEEEDIDPDDLEIIPPLYIQARSLFLQADVTPAAQVDVKWTEPDIDGLRDYLVNKMGFGADRVQSGIDRLTKAQQKKSQQRMDSFFTMMPSSSSSSSAGQKRKIDDKSTKKGTKKGSFGKKR